MPSTKSSQRLGSRLPIKATLLTASGGAVTSAVGDVLVQGMGRNGLGAPITVLALTNAFKAGAGGSYSYSLDTGLPGFVSGTYYLVTATWNDGSKTRGWFYTK